MVKIYLYLFTITASSNCCVLKNCSIKWPNLFLAQQSDNHKSAVIDLVQNVEGSTHNIISTIMIKHLKVSGSHYEVGYQVGAACCSQCATRHVPSSAWPRARRYVPTCPSCPGATRPRRSGCMRTRWPCCATRCRTTSGAATYHLQSRVMRNDLCPMIDR